MLSQLRAGLDPSLAASDASGSCRDSMFNHNIWTQKAPKYSSTKRSITEDFPVPAGAVVGSLFGVHNKSRLRTVYEVQQPKAKSTAIFPGLCLFTLVNRACRSICCIQDTPKAQATSLSFYFRFLKHPRHSLPHRLVFRVHLL